MLVRHWRVIQSWIDVAHVCLCDDSVSYIEERLCDDGHLDDDGMAKYFCYSIPIMQLL